MNNGHAEKIFHSLELILYQISLTFPDTALFQDTSLLWLIANHDGEPNSIELEYLVKGHTFMRPNAVYGAIDNKLRKKDDVHD